MAESTSPIRDNRVAAAHAIDAAGQVVITGMMTHRIYVLDPASSRTTEVEIPVIREGGADQTAVMEGEGGG